MNKENIVTYIFAGLILIVLTTFISYLGINTKTDFSKEGKEDIDLLKQQYTSNYIKNYKFLPKEFAKYNLKEFDTVLVLGIADNTNDAVELVEKQIPEIERDLHTIELTDDNVYYYEYTTEFPLYPNVNITTKSKFYIFKPTTISANLDGVAEEETYPNQIFKTSKNKSNINNIMEISTINKFFLDNNRAVVNTKYKSGILYKYYIVYYVEKTDDSFKYTKDVIRINKLGGKIKVSEDIVLDEI